MKILHVVQALRHSGAEMLVHDLAIAHAKQGIEIAVVALQPADPKFAAEIAEMEALGIRIFSPSCAQGRFSRIRWVYRACKSLNPDVIFAHSALPAIYGRLGAWKFGAAVVTVLHAPDDYANGRLRFMEKLLRHRTRAVVSVAEVAVENYNARVSGLKPIVIKNGIELSKFSFSEERRILGRKILGLADGEIAIVQIGRIKPDHKGQDLTIVACSGFLKENPKLRLGFVGILEDEIFLEGAIEQTRRLGISNQVTFWGSLGQVGLLLAAADLFVMPSHYEAHSVALLEALQSGISIVASAIEPFRPYKRFEGIALVDPNDVETFKERIAIGLESQSRFSRDMSMYSIEGTAQKYLELAKSLG